jgi:hypothetical protein
MITWGKSDRQGYQGWAKANGRYWTAAWSSLWDTLERDGPMTYDGKSWSSRTGEIVSYPFAVIDDFGDLVPVAQ